MRRSVLLHDGKICTKHLTTNLLIETAGDRTSATCRSYFCVMQATPTLVDQAALDSHEIARVAGGVEGVTKAYSIRSRGTGHQRFAELTISVPGEVSVASAHLVTDAVEDALRRDLGFHEVVVHVEPC